MSELFSQELFEEAVSVQKEIANALKKIAGEQGIDDGFVAMAALFVALVLIRNRYGKDVARYGVALLSRRVEDGPDAQNSPQPAMRPH